MLLSIVINKDVVSDVLLDSIQEQIDNKSCAGEVELVFPVVSTSLSKGLERGVHDAIGEYVIILNNPVLLTLDVDLLLSMCHHMTINTDIDFTRFSCDLINGDDVKVLNDSLGVTNESFVPRNINISILGYAVASYRCLYRRSFLLDNITFFDVNHSVDLAIMYQSFFYADCVYISDKVVVSKHCNNYDEAYLKSTQDDTFFVFESLFEKLKDDSRVSEYQAVMFVMDYLKRIVVCKVDWKSDARLFDFQDKMAIHWTVHMMNYINVTLKNEFLELLKISVSDIDEIWYDNVSDIIRRLMSLQLLVPSIKLEKCHCCCMCMVDEDYELSKSLLEKFSIECYSNNISDALLYAKSVFNVWYSDNE